MQYKVIALSVGGKNNKVFNSGEIVNDKNFHEGRAEELVRKGFLERSVKEIVIDPVKEVEKEIKEDEVVVEKTIDDYSIKELAELTKNISGFFKRMSKKQMFDLLVAGK